MIRNLRINAKNVVLHLLASAIILQLVWVSVVRNLFPNTDELSTHSSKKSTPEEIAVEDIATHAMNDVNGIDSATSGKLFLGERIRAYEGERQFSTADNRARGTNLKQAKNDQSIHCTKWNVVTTIFEPTEAVKRASNVKGWCTVIVADTKTPLDYMENLRSSSRSSNDDTIINQDGDFIVFLSVKEQLAWIEDERNSAVGRFLEALPFRHFARKNIGYLYAVAHGARTIFDFDDDNLLPLSSSSSSSNEKTVLPPLHDTNVLMHAAMVVTGPKAFNHHYIMGATVEGNTWPRGFPLTQIQNNATWGRIALDMDEYRNISISNEVGVLQFVANQNPDVDAIHRLVQGEKNQHTDAPITFSRHVKHMATDGGQQATKNYYDKAKILSTMGALVVPSHTFVPYNAQASIHTYKAMFALFLPMTVPGRVSDIWRSYFSQRIFRDVEISSANGNGAEGLKIVILPPDIEHERNEHSLIADMQAEADLYFKTEALLEFLNQWQPKIDNKADIPSLIEELWIDLYERDYVQLEDINVLQLWLSALVEVGYEFPKRPPQSRRRIKDVVLMEQFNYPKLAAGKKEGDDETKKSLIFLYQKWKQKFDTVVLRGPFSEDLAHEFRTMHEIDVRCTRQRLQHDKGYVSPMDNLLSTLKQYKEIPAVNGVLYVHDDMLINTTNIFFENGNTKNSSDSRLDTIYATQWAWMKHKSYRIHPSSKSTDINGNKSALYYSTLDGFRSDNSSELIQHLQPWNHHEICLKAFSDVTSYCMKRPEDIVCKQLLEYDDTNGVGPFFLVSAFGQSDFLYIPTLLADQYEAITQLFIDYNVFLECGIPKIIDYLLGMPSSLPMRQQKRKSTGKNNMRQQKRKSTGKNIYSTISTNDVRLKAVKLCTAWNRTRGKPEMISSCATNGADATPKSGAPLAVPYSVIHPVKLSLYGYKRWDRIFDWATTGSTFFDTSAQVAKHAMNDANDATKQDQDNGVDKSDFNKMHWERIWENAHLLPNTTNTLEKQKPLNVTLAAQYDGVLSKMNVQELFEAFPSPVGVDTIQIYNRKAYDQLIRTFMTMPERINICANGGSTTAGGGKVKGDHRYYRKLMQYIREVKVNARGADMSMTPRGHGSRHSLHSAVFAPNFIPPKTDLLLWEFSINDYGYHIPEENHVEQERSMLLAWLREVEQLRPQRPPKVILIYLWKAPFEFNDQGRVYNPVYEAHAQLAREFDFVVGHVNVASYFDELGGLQGVDDMKRLFLADIHHPNDTGHLVITFLLLHLLRGSIRDGNMDLDIQPEQSNGSEDTAKYMWFCGTDSEEKKFVRSQVVEYDSGDISFRGWRSPLGTGTAEEPQNNIQAGSRQLVFDQTSSSNKQILGKQDPVRIDRQGSISLSCCREGAPIIGYTTVSVPDDDEPMKNAQSLFLGFGRGFSDVNKLKVYIGPDEQNVKGDLIKVSHKEWPCFWSWKDVYDPMWFAFSQKQDRISSMQICVENDECDDDKESQAMLISIAVY